jgi:hypothetical protein
LEGLYQGTANEIKSQLESTANRFEIFRHPQMQRVLGVTENSIDVRRVIDDKEILLVNLQPSDIFGINQGRVLGALLLNEIWEITRRRQGKSDYFLIIDECGEYLTPDIPLILSQAAKYGLHLMLFHQYDEQIAPDMRASLQNARIKFFFGKTPRFYEFTMPGLEYPILAETLTIEGAEVDEETLQAYVSKQMEGYLTVGEIDKRLAEDRRRIATEGNEAPRTEAGEPAQVEEFSEEIFFE